MPRVLYSLAGTMTALALSLVAIYHLDRPANSPTAPTDAKPQATLPEINDDMPPRPAGASKAKFAEYSRVDLHVSTIGAYEYEPSAAIVSAATKHQSMVQFKRRTWYSLVPQSGSRGAPVVVLFHGANRSGLSMIDMWQEVAQAHGVVLLAPNAPSGRWPYAEPDARFIEQMLDEVNKATPIDRDEVFLFGHSNGAIYAQALLNQKTGPWRAAATHGGFATSKHLTPASDAKPYRMYIGSLEQTSPVTVARQMGQILADAGHTTDLVVIPYQTHWFYDSGPKIAADAWQWFDGL